MLTEARFIPMRLLAVACLSLASSGCYYLHLAEGQLALKRRQQPIAGLLQDDATPAELRASLLAAQAAREFAIQELDLPDNGSYQDFVVLGRPYVTWNIYAAAPLSLAPRRWCHLLVGCVPYRGYFDEARAQGVASRLAARGADVYVGPAIAYSTLGVLRDPLFDSMLARGPVDTAAMIFHELAHQAAWIPGDVEFNEAFASVVEAAGLRRWLAGQAELDRQQAREMQEQRAEAQVIVVREQLAALYASPRSAGEQLEHKRQLLEQLALQLGSQGEWNNARLVAFTTYQRCVPGLQRLLAELNDDLPAFYLAVRGLRTAGGQRDALCGR